ncbi:MAG: HPr family phosphocarrier protein [Eubacteriales bacterium]
MIKKKIIVKNPAGLHLRPAGILCKKAIEFDSKVTFEIRGNVANAKSVLSVLGACVKSGDELELTVEGFDEEQALIAISELIESGLGE